MKQEEKMEQILEGQKEMENQIEESRIRLEGLGSQNETLRNQMESGMTRGR